MWNGHYVIEMDEGGQAPTDSELVNGHRVSTAAVEPDFFPAFEAAPIAGRLLGPADYGDAPRVVVVNQSFVKKVLGGRNAIGRRIRYPSRRRRPAAAVAGDRRRRARHGHGRGTEPEDRRCLSSDSPSRGRVRDDRRARVRRHDSGDERLALDRRQGRSRAEGFRGAAACRSSPRMALRTINYVVRALSIVSLAALVLALSGIYAVMSFAVSRRTREIGIRVALGSQPSRVVLAILRRPLIQVATGIVFGGLLTFGIASLEDVTLGFSLVGWLGYALVMLGVCLLACVVPARRALKVDPIAALRTE